MGDFKDRQIGRLLGSGWAASPRIAGWAQECGLPEVSRAYLADAFSADEWEWAEEAARGLAERFGGARFGDDAQYGVVLVPAVELLDTRRVVPAAVRRGAGAGG